MICFIPFGMNAQLTNQRIEKTAVKILFVGNSLTYSNNLPKLVSQEAASTGIEIETLMIAYPDFSLQDHWDQKTFQRLLELSSFDYLVIQQGPSSQNEGKRTLLKYGKLFKTLSKENGTQLVYLMVWPSLQLYHSFDAVIENYTYAAQENQAILCPVGLEWKNYIETHQSFDLYSTDGFHPSEKGSQLAAKIIVASLFDNQ